MCELKPYYVLNIKRFAQDAVYTEKIIEIFKGLSYMFVRLTSLEIGNVIHKQFT